MKKYLIHIVLIVFLILMGLFFGAVVLPMIIPYGSWFNYVDGRSMEPTLKNGQLVFADCFGEIEYGDIVILKHPYEPEETIIKRIIGMPGDKITILNNQIFINDNLLEETYLPNDAKEKTAKKNSYDQEIILGLDEYYVLGDNREVSLDSRIFGPVNKTLILYEQSVSITSSFILFSGILLLSISILAIIVLKVWWLIEK